MVDHAATDDFTTCRVTNWSAVILAVFGSGALLRFRLAYAILLGPSAGLTIYSAASERYWLLVWVLLSGWGFWTSSTSPSGIGMIASFAVALIGLIIAVVHRDATHLIGGLLPGFTWLGSCATLGVTAGYLIETLRSREEMVDLLIHRGLLEKIHPIDDQNPE